MSRVLLGVSEKENVLTFWRECPRTSRSDSLNKEEKHVAAEIVSSHCATTRRSHT